VSGLRVLFTRRPQQQIQEVDGLSTTILQAAVSDIYQMVRAYWLVKTKLSRCAFYSALRADLRAESGRGALRPSPTTVGHSST